MRHVTTSSTPASASPAKRLLLARSNYFLLVTLAVALYACFASEVLAQSNPPQQKTKEYIYVGGKLVAIEDGTAAVPTPPPTPTPTPTPVTNGATFVSQAVPATMSGGQNYSVSVTMRNTGTSTWTAANSYRLGSQNAQDNTTWGLSRVNPPSSVAPGAEVVFNFTVTAPTVPGTYNFQWRMVRDSVEWFGEYSPNFLVTVPAPPTISGFTPTIGAVGTSVTISGTNFTPLLQTTKSNSTSRRRRSTRRRPRPLRRASPRAQWAGASASRRPPARLRVAETSSCRRRHTRRPMSR